MLKGDIARVLRILAKQSQTGGIIPKQNRISQYQSSNKKSLMKLMTMPSPGSDDRKFVTIWSHSEGMSFIGLPATRKSSAMPRGHAGMQITDDEADAGNFLLIYICNFHILSHLLLNYICKLHWNFAAEEMNDEDFDEDYENDLTEEVFIVFF